MGFWIWVSLVLRNDDKNCKSWAWNCRHHFHYHHLLLHQDHGGGDRDGDCGGDGGEYFGREGEGDV